MARAETLSNVIPLIITLIFLTGVAVVCYQIWVSWVKIQAQAKQQMGKKNVVFTKDGVRVGVKHVENEVYVDRTQSWAVKAWNLAAESKDAKTKK
ncbi:hypothetical protein OQA88_8833 [Cercophora sp. LCS_1]